MRIEDISRISVLGAGIMGHGIAQSFAMGGYDVTLYSRKKKTLTNAEAHIEISLEMFIQEGLLTISQAKAAQDRVAYTTDLDAAAVAADLIAESVVEDMDVKQALFEKLEQIAKPEAILASNTSHLPLSELFQKVRIRHRSIGMHWFNPPSIVPGVEVVKARDTSAETSDITCKVLQRIGKVPVRVEKDVSGYIINRLVVALVREACELLQNEVADAENIDRALVTTFGFRCATIGMLRQMDLGGIDGWEDACRKLLPEIANRPQAPQILQDLVSSHKLGIRSGQGFFSYERDYQHSELDEVVKNRDMALLGRLKNNYWKK